MQTVSEKKLLLKSGIEVSFRPIRISDTDYLIDIFDHLSPDSRYQRFQQSVEGIPKKQVIQIAAQTALDSVEHGFGLIAFGRTSSGPSSALGGARYFVYKQTPECGELAITIRDDMHGQGLGTQLLFELIDSAKRRGVRYLTGVALASNRGLWQLLKRTELPLERWYDGPDMYFKLTL